jgi:phosphorylcholine metabolism protein LicD
MHVHFTGHKMDLFIIYRNYGPNNNAYGHMQNYKLREFPQTLLEPLSTLEFKGKTFYAPADIPGFLEERYGPGWTKSDPTYEM